MNRVAVFLDRDGLIIEDISESIDNKVKVLPTVIDGLRLLKKQNLILIVVTNQPEIAKGLLTMNDVENAHRELNKILKRERCEIDAFYCCPHHPTLGIIKEYSFRCGCRKPEIGLLKESANDFNLKLEDCFLIGDYTWDILMGKKVKCTTILVKNKNRSQFEIEKIIKESKPDFYCKNFYQAAKTIISYL